MKYRVKATVSEYRYYDVETDSAESAMEKVWLCYDSLQNCRQDNTEPEVFITEVSTI